jgi:hypothetical protein
MVWCMFKYLAIAVLLTCSVAAQRPAVSLRGTWTASSGSAQAFRGTWAAEIRPEAPNTARGSWTVLDAENRIVLQGTWSAQKNARTWQGSWSAVVATRAAGRSTSGRPISGMWQAETEVAGTGTLLEMLQRTIEKEVTGTWQSGRLGGRWVLKGSRP